MANLNDVRVAGWIGPFFDTDTYYCIDPLYGIDGSRSVPDKATRNAITQERRRQGMFVVVQQDFGDGINTVWQLNPPPWDNTDADWTQFPVSTVTSIVGGDLSGTLPNPTVVSINGIAFGTMSTQNANDVDITGGIITGLSTPISASDAVNKSYVDAVTTGLSPKNACHIATTTNLGATYSNGASGVGATLTNSGTLAAFSADGITPSVNARVLVKNQTSDLQNGIYSVTNAGSGSVAWVLTRTNDYNSPVLVAAGTYTVVSAGTINGGTLWVETGVGPFTVGTTPVIFTQLNIPPLTFTFAGDISGTGSGTISTTVLSINSTPLGSTIAVAGNLLIASGTQWVSVHPTGDATISAAGVIVVTKTNGVSFAPSATTDTTDATNITSGILSVARLGTGTANSTTFLRGDGVWEIPPSGGGSLTSIDTGPGLTGGPITTSGTVAIASGGVLASMLDIGAAAINVGSLGGDLSGSLPNPTVVKLGGTLFGTMAIQNSNTVAITGGTITGVPAPVGGSDVVNKNYVDAITTGLSPRQSCVMSTTVNLTATYNNGTGGIGATLTNSGTLATFVADGITATAGNRVLIKNQITLTQNGIYTVTNAGSGSVAWVLTRATDYNTSSLVTAGTYVVIVSGTVNAGTLWIETNPGPFTLGTTGIVFTKLNVISQTTIFTGDMTGSGSGTIATTVMGLQGTPISTATPTAGNLLIASGTEWSSVAMTGDASISSTGVILVTKTNGVSFATSATTDTTNATNITSGTLAAARIAPIAESQVVGLVGDLASLSGSIAGIAGLSAIPSHDLMANPTGASAVPFGVTLSSYLDLTAGAVPGKLLARGNSLWGAASTGIKIDQHYGTVIVPSGTSGTIDIDLSLGDWFKPLTITGVFTLNLSNSIIGQQFSVVLTQAVSGGPYLVNWFDGIIWMGAPYTAPTMPVTASGVLVATFKCIDEGVYLGWWLGNSAT